MGTLEKIGVSAAIGLGTAVVSLAGVLIHKINRLSKKFDRSVSELEDATIKDIQKVVVQDAVEKAAKTSVDSYMRDVNTVVLADARAELRRQTSAAIDLAKKDIQQKVSDEISEEAARLDMADLRREVREKAEKKVLDKFDDDLQDVLDRCNGTLSQAMSVYTNVANVVKKAVGKEDDKGVKLTFG